MPTLALVVLILAGGGAALSPERIRDATREVLSDEAYQQEFPLAGRADPSGEPELGSGSGGAAAAERARLGARRSKRAIDGAAAPPPGWLPAFGLGGASPIFRLIGWALGAAAVLLLLLWLARTFGERAALLKPERPARAREAPPDPAARLERALGDAEAAAAEGRFGEAIHVLLLRSLGALGRREDLAASLTAREVVARTALEEEPRGALSDLVAAVERSLFAGRAPGRPEYERCAERFRVLEVACAAGRR